MTEGQIDIILKAFDDFTKRYDKKIDDLIADNKEQHNDIKDAHKDKYQEIKDMVKPVVDAYIFNKTANEKASKLMKMFALIVGAVGAVYIWLYPLWEWLVDKVK